MTSNLLENLEKLSNPFVDTILRVLSKDSEVLCSLAEAVWQEETNQLLLQVVPINPDSYQSIKESTVDLIREAASFVKFQADPLELKVSGRPGMLFKITKLEN